MKYFWRVLHYLCPYWKLACGSVLITIASVVARLLTPWPLKLLVDNVLGNQPVPPALASLSASSGHDRSVLLADVGQEAFREADLCVIFHLPRPLHN
jgi:ATP-binding cassette, subfamily B, bacterial